MLGCGVRIGVDCCAAHTEGRGCSSYSKGDFAAVGYENGAYGSGLEAGRGVVTGVPGVLGDEDEGAGDYPQSRGGSW